MSYILNFHILFLYAFAACLLIYSIYYYKILMVEYFLEEMKHVRLFTAIIYIFCSMVISALLSGATIKTLSRFYFSATSFLIEIFEFSNILILAYLLLFNIDNFKEAFNLAEKNQSKSFSYATTYMDKAKAISTYSHLSRMISFFLIFLIWYLGILIYLLKREKKNIYLKEQPNIFKMEFEIEKHEKDIKTEADDVIVSNSALSVNKN